MQSSLWDFMNEYGCLQAEFLVGVHSYLGYAYDFDLELTVRTGHETLSADDIANYHLASAEELFDFILLVETDPATEKSALIYTGKEGEEKLKNLMDSVKGSGSSS